MLTMGGGTAILVDRGIKHYSVPVTGLTHLEATAINVMLAGGPVRVLAAYLPLCRPILRLDLSACFDGGIPVLLAGDLNTNHMYWNSRLTTRGKPLHDYANENSCLIYGPENPTTVPYRSSASPADTIEDHYQCLKEHCNASAGRFVLKPWSAHSSGELVVCVN